MNTREWNFDGLVGPTHTFAGLAVGNMASAASLGSVSNPRAAALQGLTKMRRLIDLGVSQGILPPHPRPDVRFLRSVGFSGDDSAVLSRAVAEAPDLFLSATSASPMWVANAATVVPSSDSPDGRVHFTPANLTSQLHRSLEPPMTKRILDTVFGDRDRFVVGTALPSQDSLGDEGAANHTRFGRPGEPGAHLFVYGRRVGHPEPSDRRFRGRQTDLASAAVARGGGLDGDRVLFAQQHPDAIDAGVFHNDVIAVGHEYLLICHEQAFVDQPEVVGRLREMMPGMRVAELPGEMLDLAAAVRSYLFNSQLVTAEDGRTVLVAPSEVVRVPAARAAVDGLVEGGHVDAVELVDLSESMGNGGGPACLRLRVELTDAEAEAVGTACRLDHRAVDRLEEWVHRHYRDELVVSDLADPQLLEESRRALDELTGVLGLGLLYDFQRA